MLIGEDGQRLVLRVTEPLARALAERSIFRWLLDADPIRDEPGPVVFAKSAEIEPYANWPHGGNFTTMGAFSFSNSNLMPEIKIGRYCSISWGVEVMGFQHPIDRLTTANFTFTTAEVAYAAALRDAGLAGIVRARGGAQKPPPVVGHDVWIGAHVTLAGGITIGTGAIVAARAVVTRTVEPYTIVGGNPARVIRRRFSDALSQ